MKVFAARRRGAFLTFESFVLGGRRAVARWNILDWRASSQPWPPLPTSPAGQQANNIPESSGLVGCLNGWPDDDPDLKEVLRPASVLYTAAAPPPRNNPRYCRPGAAAGQEWIMKMHRRAG